MKFSVLMSVYSKEQPQNLRACLDSIRRQSLLSDDIVLVCDGPLTRDLDQVIEDARFSIGDALQVVRLHQNVGLGKALNEGIKYCKHNLVARMDTDDIAYPDRFEKQTAVFAANPALGIVGAAVAEFVDEPGKAQTYRVPPAEHESILKYAQKRCPFNHPCVMFRKHEVKEAGGYQDFYLLEDYYLWIRMLMNGTLSFNIQEPLLWMRIGKQTFLRRGGWKYAKSLVRLYTFMYKSRFIGFPLYVSLCVLRVGVALAPGRLREFIYIKVLRKS